MSNPEIIDIKLSNVSSSPASPKLSVVGSSDNGIIRLNNLPQDEEVNTRRSVNFGPGADLLINHKFKISNSRYPTRTLKELKNHRVCGCNKH